MTLIIFLITSAFIVFTALIDASHILEGQYFKSHNYRFLQRACFFIVVFIYNWQIGIASILLFIALFDSVLNILLESPLFYLGTTSKWDKFFRKNKWLQIPVKLTAFIISIYLFINEM